MSQVTPLDRIKTTAEITCSRSDFLEAMAVINAPAEDITAAIEEREEQNLNNPVAQILKIARWGLTKHNIIPGTATSSEELLRSLENSPSYQVQGIGHHVRKIVSGIINTVHHTLSESAVIEAQKKIPHWKRLSLKNAMILERIQLDECSIGDLAKFFHVSPMSMSGFIDRLENDGYVKRYKKPSNKRNVYVKLLQKGSTFVKKVQSKIS